MYKFLLVLCLTANVSYSAVTVQLADFLVSTSGLAEILAKQGIRGNDSKQVQSYVASSLAVLGSKNSTMTKADLTKILAALPPATGKDAAARKELEALLQKDASQVKKADLVNAINNLIYVANRYGTSVIITCAECVNENLARDGFKFTAGALKDAKSNQILSEVIPKNPAQLNTFISSRMKKLGMGDYSKVTTTSVLPEDEKSLALFLGLAENGSTEQKALVDSIKKLSTKNGKTNIIDPKNPHKFWKILADDMSPEDMAGWTKTLNEVAARAEKDKVTAEEAFYRTLKDKAEGNDYLMKQYEILKAKKCFFK
jgi:hypothetical protein